MAEAIKKQYDFHELNEKLGSIMERVEKYAVYAGRILFIMYHGQGYKELGYESWGEYLSGGIREGRYSLSQAQASKLMGVFEKWCVLHKHKLDEMNTDAEKLYLTSRVLDAKHDGENCACHDVLQDTISLSRSDLRIKYFQEDEEKYKRQQKEIECPKCHARFCV